MDDELRELLDRAKSHVMSAKERYEQKVSFIYGMQKLSTPGYSKEQIREALAEQGELDPDLCTHKGEGMCDDPECPIWKAKVARLDIPE